MDEQRGKWMRIVELEYANHRYHDSIRWSGLRWIFLLEGGLIYISYFIRDIGKWNTTLIVAVGAVFIWLFSILLIKAGINAEGHLHRVTFYSDNLRIKKYTEYFNDLEERILWKKIWRIRGLTISVCGLLLLNLFNIYLVFDAVFSIKICSSYVLPFITIIAIIALTAYLYINGKQTRQIG